MRACTGRLGLGECICNRYAGQRHLRHAEATSERRARRGNVIPASQGLFARLVGHLFPYPSPRVRMCCVVGCVRSGDGLVRPPLNEKQYEETVTLRRREVHLHTATLDWCARMDPE